jgi:hypothetical protein
MRVQALRKIVLPVLVAIGASAFPPDESAWSASIKPNVGPSRHFDAPPFEERGPLDYSSIKPNVGPA